MWGGGCSAWVRNLFRFSPTGETADRHGLWCLSHGRVELDSNACWEVILRLCHLDLVATFGTIGSFLTILSLTREETLVLSVVDHVLFKEAFRALTIYKAVILHYGRCWTVVANPYWSRQVSI